MLLMVTQRVMNFFLTFMEFKNLLLFKETPVILRHTNIVYNITIYYLRIILILSFCLYLGLASDFLPV